MVRKLKCEEQLSQFFIKKKVQSDANIPANLKKKKRVTFKTVACQMEIRRRQEYQTCPMVIENQTSCIILGRHTVEQVMIRTIVAGGGNYAKITCIKKGRERLREWAKEDYGIEQEDQEGSEEESSVTGTDEHRKQNEPEDQDSEGGDHESSEDGADEPGTSSLESDQEVTQQGKSQDKGEPDCIIIEQEDEGTRK